MVVINSTAAFNIYYICDSSQPTDSPEKLQQTCPTCPLLLPADSQVAVDMARITLSSYKRKSTMAAQLGVKKITRASAQVSFSKIFSISPVIGTPLELLCQDLFKDEASVEFIIQVR